MKFKNPIKFKNFDFRKVDPIDIMFCLAFVLILFGLIGGFINVQTTQKALNEQCNTHYTFMQVAFAGDNLSRLCQIKNQTVTIK